MALSPEGGTAPYAPAATIVSVIDGYRRTGFAGQPITDVTLARIQVSPSLIPRTLASLRQLGLIDEDGKPTDQFDVLKNAPTDEFPSRLAEWLKDTYAPIFGFCNPDTATAQQIEDAFRGFSPEGQRGRMATLFLGLATYAGIVEDAPSKPRGRHATGQRKPNQAPSAALRKGGTPEQQTPPPSGDSHRQRYLDLLMAKAEEQDEPDPELLDRIERALGIGPKQEAGT